MATALVIVNARLWDGHDRGDTAVAMEDGRVVATGTRETLEPAGSGARVVDVGGRRVVPGLIDSHLHLVRAGRTWNDEVRWDGLTTLDDAVGALREKARDLGPGAWVGVMGGWHPNQFASGERPSREVLDRAVPDNPVFVQRAYAETFVNTAAMAAMGWTIDEVPDGCLTSPADMAVLRARLATNDTGEAMSGTRHLLRELNGLGLTGAIDTAGFGITPESYEALHRLFTEGERGFRLRLLVGPASPGGEMEDLKDWTSSVSLPGDDEFVRYLGAGEVLDYAAHDVEGLAPKDIADRVESLAEICGFLAGRDWPVHLHSILDSSIGVVLDAWESLDTDLSSLRWAICHADQVGPENLKRIADLGVGITIQNGMSMRGVDCGTTWSADAIAQSPPIRTMLDLGIPVAAGTDGTVACAYNPWRCISWLVTGESVDGAPARIEAERLTRDEALRLYTSAGAWFSFEEDTRGQLSPGSHADLAVLSADPMTCAESEIADITSVLTVVAGEIVHTTLEEK